MAGVLIFRHRQKMETVAMSPDKTIRMANQIALFFNAQGGDDAPAAVASHLKQFWDPRMRAKLIELVDDGAVTGTGGDEVRLDPVVIAAVGQLRNGDTAA